METRLPRSRAWELYDMEADREELHDLAKAQPERVNDMSRKWESWANRTNVLPRPNVPNANSGRR
ncbi:MAG UNVERIFIED_CONTAM: hypothetical protein LVR18_49035 [Planctomycetaceae bacterium]